MEQLILLVSIYLVNVPLTSFSPHLFKLWHTHAYNYVTAYIFFEHLSIS